MFYARVFILNLDLRIIASFMNISETDLILVTGATGLVGSHVVEQAMKLGYPVRAMVRTIDEDDCLANWGAQKVVASLEDPVSLQKAVEGVTIVVHCAAMVGDWGPTQQYRAVNVDGTKALLKAATKAGSLKRWVQISSLGVYPGTDHYGTDESVAASTKGIDGYTLTKVESENVIRDAIQNQQLPAVILRPGFIYGPRDRTVMPRLLERLQSGRFAYLGNTDKLMNNTFVGNLCEAIWLAIANDEVVSEVFNIRDAQAVTKQTFIDTICEAAVLQKPSKVVPLPVAKFLAWHLETIYKLFRIQNAPLVNSARIKFLGRNLDFDISKAQARLGYQPSVSFADAMPDTVKWFLANSQ